jgi:hypothetical protein
MLLRLDGSYISMKWWIVGIIIIHIMILFTFEQQMVVARSCSLSSTYVDILTKEIYSQLEANKVHNPSESANEQSVLSTNSPLRLATGVYRLDDDERVEYASKFTMWIISENADKYVQFSKELRIGTYPLSGIHQMNNIGDSVSDVNYQYKIKPLETVVKLIDTLGQIVASTNSTISDLIDSSSTTVPLEGNGTVKVYTSEGCSRGFGYAINDTNPICKPLGHTYEEIKNLTKSAPFCEALGCPFNPPRP